MAPGRIYRDYSTEDDSFTALPQRTPSATHKKTAWDPSSSPRTVISVEKAYDESSSENQSNYSFDDNGPGVARTTDEIDARRPDDHGIRKFDGYDARNIDHFDSSINTSTASSPHEEKANPMPKHTKTDGQYSDSARPRPSISNRDSASTAIPSHAPKTRDFPRSTTAMSEVSQNGRSIDARSIGGASISKMPEFFSHSIFHTVLHSPTIAHQLLKFGEERLCGENMDFLARVHRYHKLLNEVQKSIYEIHKDFIASTAPTQINVSQNLLLKVNNDMRSALATTIPSLETMLTPAQSDIEQLVYTDIYPRFVRYQMSVNAAKALATDRSKYAGLGDCFVLTDPSKADNPILYASDGFVKVTGYQRNEIIPRNCRFLQGRFTDQSSVKRLKASIEKREQSVELLLNQKKNGEPFWNLLYTTPLYDQNGKLVFFLGGQINCSTTVHSTSDVLRILGQSKDTDEDAVARASSPTAVRPTKSRSILNPFRSNRQAVPPRAAGMENVLLDKLEEMPLKSQMNTFYTAYSNFIIINYSSFLVTFISNGISDLLFPIKAKNHPTIASPTQAIGIDIFKFLSNHGTGSLSWDFKSSVKSALRAGQPISIDIKLCARPYMGFERFIAHWTPLKDEGGGVSWVVVTLGNEQRA